MSACCFAYLSTAFLWPPPTPNGIASMCSRGQNQSLDSNRSAARSTELPTHSLTRSRLFFPLLLFFHLACPLGPLGRVENNRFHYLGLLVKCAAPKCNESRGRPRWELTQARASSGSNSIREPRL